ncbi:hypothetical protein [Pedobacter cryophilus]|uniref:Right handed beta helix domain-containing protein n=1 Tax=Pedobacter cryophilus TaxID=2571271 RepID=A0A4U1C5K9_9SPHI|nr:hypothetical protein [Pedobacter cryophilus]TKC00575.1 hypothetical protein FA046_02545 [Pedobacter cryophilus]
MKNFILVFSFLILVISACRKDEIIDDNPNIQLQFSTDSILFDTIFTNSGSTSRVLKIFNYNKNSIIISDIHLKGGSSSAFKININGVASSAISNLKIRGNDSVYVFVKAFIDPNNINSPFIVEDEISITMNGNLEKIPLQAYGQNAIYLNGATINTNTTFTKDKPYIIYNYAIVNQNVTLQINPGAKLFFHKGATLFVSGSLKANGTFADSITFSSDRLERIYDDEPGQWGGIHILRPSFDNQINYAAIKNALVGIRVDSLSNNANPKLLLSNSIVKNHEVAGLLGYTASVIGLNNLFYNCGQFLVIGLYGGNYAFYQNTLANYNFNFPRKTPSVFFSDNLNDNTTITKGLSTIFINNIIYGSLTRELEFDKKGTGLFITDFQNNLIRTDIQTLGNSNIYNQDPLFINTRKENYKLPANSVAVGKGKDLTTNSYFNSYLSKDLEQNNRIFPSVLGCYEK